jgi:hypothetical protein
MSDDPETVRQIAELALSDRPLLVLDVDEVVLEFVRPFVKFLETQDLLLKTDSFRIHGNVFDRSTRLPVQDQRVTTLMTAFFEAQETWQTAVDGAAAAVAELAAAVEVVMLSSMPHGHRPLRRRLLDRLGFPYPLLTTEAAKGPAIQRMRGGGGRPVAFVDDIPNNLLSVQRAVPDARLFHLMAHSELRALLLPLPEGIVAVSGWREAGPLIAKALKR